MNVGFFTIKYEDNRISRLNHLEEISEMIQSRSFTYISSPKAIMRV